MRVSGRIRQPSLRWLWVLLLLPGLSLLLSLIPPGHTPGSERLDGQHPALMFSGLRPILSLGILRARSGFAETVSDGERGRHRKLCTALADLARAIPQQGGPILPGQPVAPPPRSSMGAMPKSVRDAVRGRTMRINKDGEVQVYILVAELTDDTVRQLEATGARVEFEDKRRRRVQARVPVSRLEAVAALPMVQFVRLPSYGFPHTGSVDTQGDAILEADKVRSLLHVDGSGVRVGVISDGIKGIFATGCTSCPGVALGPISTGDLPTATGTRNAAGTLIAASGGITAESFSANSDLEGLPPPGCAFAGAGAEGTALMEIVHDLAPGAQLFFANFDTSMTFNQAVDFLASQTDVVVDDILFFGEPYDGTSDVSTHTADALNSPSNPIRVYFTAVGNEAREHYRGDFVDSKVDGTSLVGTPGDLHLFQKTANTSDILGLGPTVTDKILLPPSGEVVVFLVWNDPFGASSNDYNLFLVRESTQTVVAKSTDPQTGTQDPVEFIDYVNETGSQDFFHIVIQNVGNRAAVRNLNLFLFQPECAAAGPLRVLPPNHERHNYNTVSSSVPAHSDAGGAPVSVISVGAIRASDPGNVDIEFFSSNGPTLDGRLKPDVTGIDGVSITGAGNFENPFFGTSAAAPHGAGVAALLLQAASCLREGGINNVTARTTLRNLMLNNAVDLGSPGPNNVFGFGRINALAAANLTIPSSSAVPKHQTISGNIPTGASLSAQELGFSDPDGCPLTLSASGGCATGSGSPPTVNCPFGTSSVSLSATNNGVTFSSSANVEITITDFTLGVAPASTTVQAGKIATYTVTVTPQIGPFTNTVSLGCADLPVHTLCSFSPGVLTPGGNAVTSMLTVSTTAASTLLTPPFGYRRNRPLYTFWLVLGALAAVSFGVAAAQTHRSVKRGAYLSLGLLLALLLLQAACGGGGGGGLPPPPAGTPPGTYNIMITGTSGSLEPSTSATLVVH